MGRAIWAYHKTQPCFHKNSRLRLICSGKRVQHGTIVGVNAYDDFDRLYHLRRALIAAPALIEPSITSPSCLLDTSH